MGFSYSCYLPPMLLSLCNPSSRDAALEFRRYQQDEDHLALSFRYEPARNRTPNGLVSADNAPRNRRRSKRAQFSRVVGEEGSRRKRGQESL